MGADGGGFRRAVPGNPRAKLWRPKAGERGGLGRGRFAAKLRLRAVASGPQGLQVERKFPGVSGKIGRPRRIELTRSNSSATE